MVPNVPSSALGGCAVGESGRGLRCVRAQIPIPFLLTDEEGDDLPNRVNERYVIGAKCRSRGRYKPLTGVLTVPVSRGLNPF